jgi:predicted RNase H-like HicB family nuclease
MSIGQVMPEFDVIIEQDEEGYYIASVPALAGCHTQARSLDELMERVKEAVEVYRDPEELGPGERPLRFIGVQRLAIDA